METSGHSILSKNHLRTFHAGTTILFAVINRNDKKRELCLPFWYRTSCFGFYLFGHHINVEIRTLVVGVLSRRNFFILSIKRNKIPCMADLHIFDIILYVMNNQFFYLSVSGESKSMFLCLWIIRN